MSLYANFSFFSFPRIETLAIQIPQKRNVDKKRYKIMCLREMRDFK